MAIVKPIKVRIGNLAGLRAVVDYVKNNNKTDNGKLIHTKDCLKDTEFQQMFITKKAYGKDTGRQYAHFIQSFSESDNLTAEKTFEIGKQFLERIASFKDFQVLMAVHTDRRQFHIHYIINSVSHVTGQKWQSTPQDLKHMRAVSDELCREYGLSVIEHGNRGHKSYGEYTAGQNSGNWKQMLARNIVDCVENSLTKVDFIHALDRCGIDADFGKNNIMFTVRTGTCGLENERKCSNFKLMSYGDFSRENIMNHFKANRGILEMAFDDPQLVQDAFLDVGRMLYPHNPTELQDLYVNGLDYVDFDAMTRDEIEAYLKRKALERLRKKTLAEHMKQSQKRVPLLASVSDILELIAEWRQERIQDDYFTYEQENEFEL